jgi:hypothetical protein
MGNDYYNCDHCNAIFCEGGDYYTFQIEGLDDCRCCDTCMNEVREMLKPSALPSYYWLVRCASERFVFPERFSFEEWCREHKELAEHKDTRFAIWKDKYFDKNQREIWIHDRKQGGVLSIDAIEFKLKSIPSSRQRRGGWDKNQNEMITIPASVEWSTTIAWKDYKDYEDSSCIVLFNFSASSIEQLRKDISDFIQNKKLQNVPMLAVSKENSRQTLKFFVCPEDSSNFSTWYASSQELLDKWHNGDLVEWRSIRSWKPTQKFVESQLKQIESELSDLNYKKRQLETVSDKQEDNDNEEDDNDEQNKVQRVI